MKEINQSDYDSILLNSIPILNSLKFSEGSEGRAYFLGDFVIKTYDFDMSEGEEFGRIFPLYCQELQNFAELGYKVPKIYSWAKIPTKFGNRTYDKYYILEERIIGREFYSKSLIDFYKFYKSDMTFRQYSALLNNSKLNEAQHKDILSRFLKDYILANEFFNSLPESILAEFISSNFNLAFNGVHSLPDIRSSNILVDFDNQKLTNIDFLLADNISNPHSREDLTFDVLFGFMMTFSNNEFADHEPIDFYTQNYTNNSSVSELKDLIEKNKKLSKATVQRFIRLMKKYVEISRITDPNKLKIIYSNLSRFLSQEDSLEIIKEIPTSFEKWYSWFLWDWQQNNIKLYSWQIAQEVIIIVDVTML